MAFHGFLGCDRDWNHFKDSPLRLEIDAPSLFSPESQSVETDDKPVFPDFLKHGSQESLENWAKFFLSSYNGGADVLLGYSMGGRLALHLYELAPERWREVILISTHLGIENRIEREKRVLHDQKWAERFRRDDWQSLLNDWNAQEVFARGVVNGAPDRRESNFDREKLALALENWSTGRQKDFRPLLTKSSVSIEYVVGELDEKYLQFSKEIKQLNPRIRVTVVPNQGHRVGAW